MENQLNLDKVSAVKTEKERKDGKVSRKYYTAYFSDAANPFGKVAQRNFFQVHNADGTEASWKTADPEKTASFIGRTIPGEIVTRKVAPYELNGKMVNSYTTIVLKGETVESVFKQQNHSLVSESAPIVAEAPATALN